MRLIDFIKEAQDLMEVPMSPGALEKFASSSEAEGIRMGFEAEVYGPNLVPEPQYDNEWTREGEATESVETILSFFAGDDGVEYFEGGEALVSMLEEAMFEWFSNQIEQMIEDGTDGFLDYVSTSLDDEIPASDFYKVATKQIGNDSDDATEALALKMAIAERKKQFNNREGFEYNEAKGRAEEQFRDDQMGQMSEYDFFREGPFKTMGDVFSASENLRWPYEYQSGGDVDLEDLAGEFSRHIGEPVLHGEYHSNKDSINSWRVETDDSLSEPSTDGDGGAEFISPPLPLGDAIAAFKDFVIFAKANDLYTNASTGLHINISVPDQSRETTDYVKLVLFSGDKYMLDQFNRIKNTYAVSAHDIVLDKTKNADNVAAALDKMKTDINQEASKLVHDGLTDKYISINNNGDYIEFRGPGGDYLAGEQNDLVTATLRFAQALSIASDPTAHKQEYAKKLYKMLVSKQTSKVDLFTEYVAGRIQKNELITRLKRKRHKKKTDRRDARRRQQELQDILDNDPEGILGDKE